MRKCGRAAALFLDRKTGYEREQCMLYVLSRYP
jgi:hypothetical protein